MCCVYQHGDMHSQEAGRCFSISKRNQLYNSYRTENSFLLDVDLQYPAQLAISKPEAIARLPGFARVTFSNSR